MGNVGERFLQELRRKCINFLYKKQAQPSVFSNEQRGLPQYFKMWLNRLPAGAPDLAGELLQRSRRPSIAVFKGPTSNFEGKRGEGRQ